MKRFKISFSKRDIVYLCIILLLAIALSLTLVLLMTDKNDGSGGAEKSYYDLKCESFSVQNANLAKGQIAFIGDSITDLYALDGYYSDLPLATYNRGISGDTTEGVLKRLEVSLFDIKPSAVVLMIGTNDVGWGREKGEIINTYRDIVDEIYKKLPDVKLYCMSIIPMGKDLFGYGGIDVNLATEKIIEINSEIEKIALAKGATYVDLFSLLADENNYLIKKYTDDNLHLNDEGYKIWTAALKEKLQ